MSETSEILRIADGWRTTVDPGDAVLIGNLLQAYALYTDAALPDQLASLFTEQATWDGSALGYAVVTGRDAIVGEVLRHADPAKPMLHLPGPPLLVRVDDDTAEVFSWTLATRHSDGLTKPFIFFSYTDTVVRAVDGWRFASRHLHLTLPRP